MKFGLILCTYGRSWNVVGKFIESLFRNDYKNWELVIVDQNENDKIEKAIFTFYEKEICENKIKYFRVNFKGLSASRNFGLTKLSQDVDIIAFPDDDCEYPEDLLSKVIGRFKKYEHLDIITGISYDKEKIAPSSSRWRKDSGSLNLYNVWISGISYTIFINRRFIKELDILSFDQKLGVGSGTEFGSGEETDLIINLLKHGKKGHFFLDIIVYHPDKKFQDINRIKLYSRGMGAVLRKNFMFDINYVRAFVELMIVRPAGGILLNLLGLNFHGAKLYLITLLNRWIGFLKWRY